MNSVLILRGLPGSGKSHYARSTPGALVVSADRYFERTEPGSGRVRYDFDPSLLPQAHGACLRRYVGALCEQDTASLVVDNTNLTAAEIAPYYALAQAYGAEVQIVTVCCDPERAFARQTHGVPRGVFDRMAAVLDAEVSRFPPWWRHTRLHAEG